MADHTGFSVAGPDLSSGPSFGGTTAGFAPVDFGGAVYVNRVWHIANAVFVRWHTANVPDPTGVNYPGPGVFGVATFPTAEIESVI